MRNRSKRYGVWPAFFFIMLVSACGPSLDITKKTVLLAERNYEAAKNLAEVDEEKYRSELQTSGKELEKAESSLDKGFRGMAYKSAAKSLTLSQQVMLNVYRNTVAPLARELKRKIESIEDSENPLKDPRIVQRLDRVLDYSEQISDVPKLSEKNPLDTSAEQKIMELADIVIQDFASVAKIKEVSDTGVNKTLESDFSFDIGQYELSGEGRSILRQFCREIVEGIGQESLIARIKVVGYTDEVGFNEGKPLFKKLMIGVEDEAPPRHPERRQFFNRRLSEFRARTISEYMEREISDAADRAGLSIRIESETVGRGEEIPSGIEPQYPTKDSRRRICKIYIYRAMDKDVLELM